MTIPSAFKFNNTITNNNVAIEAALESAFSPSYNPILEAIIASNLSDNNIIRKKLTTNVVYFVSTTGNDTNAGTSPLLPLATVQKAYTIIASTLDLSGFTAFILIADGVYTSTNTSILNITSAWVGGGNVAIQSTSGIAANVSLNSINSSLIAVGVPLPGNIFISNVSLANTISGNIINGGAPGIIICSGVIFGQSPGVHCLANVNGSQIALSNYTIAGGGSAHWFAASGGNITCNTATITLVGTPAFAVFAVSRGLSYLFIPSITFAGTGATGQKYISDQNAVINTNGGGINYIPGSTPGTGTNSGVSPFGLYI